MPVKEIAANYKLGQSEIYKILAYPAPERARPGRKGPAQKLIDRKIDEIIGYCSEKWENRILDYASVCKELEFDCMPSTPRKGSIRGAITDALPVRSPI